jgi:CspA family cold shock protein
MQGKIKWYNPEKGFGFIVPDGGGDDVFVHKSNLQWAGLDSLEPGQHVTFDIRQNERTGKIAATNLKLQEKAA